MNKKLFCISLLVLGLGACNKSSTNNDPVDNVREIVKDASIQEKTFRGDCQGKPVNEIVTGLLTLGEASVKSQRIQYRFAGANASRVTHLYSTRDCTGAEALTFEESGDLRIQDSQKTADQATFIDFNYLKLELTISSQEGVVIANRIGICNRSDWAINNSQDVTAMSAELSCYNMQTPRQEFNVYRIDNGNTLYFGTSAKVNTPESRPAAIKTDLKYTSE